MKARPHTLIVTGGGTGGHVLAGIAIADAWKAKFTADKDVRIIFVGARGGIEEKLVPRAGYPLQLLSLGSLKGVSISKRLKTMVQLPLCILKSVSILLKEKPAAVVGVGGYASGPVVMMAKIMGGLWGAHVSILEQNAVPGFTNRVLSRFSDEVLCAFPGIEKQFSGKKIRVTGNPVRETMRPMTSAAREPFTIFIFGGSQGAKGVNTLVLDALPFLTDLKPRLKFIHQTGEADYSRVFEGHQKAGTQARVEKFIYEMPDAYREASLLICRAGSSTLAETAAVGRASVLIPFPFASDNHQEKNAQLFVDAGAARLLPQFKSNGEDLARIIRELVLSPASLTDMEKAVSTFYRPRAAQDVVESLL